MTALSFAYMVYCIWETYPKFICDYKIERRPSRATLQIAPVISLSLVMPVSLVAHLCFAKSVYPFAHTTQLLQNTRDFRYVSHVNGSE